MIRFLTVITFLFISLSLFSQHSGHGVPMIKNITPKEYGYESQNYSIVQDHRGIIYVGNLNGVLEYDGISWRLIKINGVPRLCYSMDSIVYVAGYNEFGFLGHDEFFNTVYISLVDKCAEADRNFGHVREIIALDNEILFYTNDKILRYTNDKIEVIDSTGSGFNIFQVNDRVYVHKDSIGLINYVHNGFDTLPNDDFFKGIIIDEILPFGDSELLIYSSEPSGFYIYDYKSVAPFETEIDQFLKNNKLTDGSILSNSNYVFGTERSGLAIIDEKGKYICGVNKKNGLNDDYVSSIFVDRSNSLWVSLSNGLARIEYPSPYSYFRSNSGIKGGISSIIRQDGVVYVATTQGVYYFQDNDHSYHENKTFTSPTLFNPIEGIQTECNILISVNNELLVTTNDGVYEIKNQKANRISEGLLETISKSGVDSTVYYFAKEDGLAIVKYENDEYREIGSLQKLDKHVRTIAESEDGTLWLGSDYHGVFMVNFQDTISLDKDVVQFKESYGLPLNHEWIDVYSTSNGVLFSTNKGLLRFDDNTLKFDYDTLLGIDFAKDERWAFPIVEDNKNNIWLSTGVTGEYQKTTAVAKYQGRDEPYRLVMSEFNNLKDYTIEAIFPDTNGIVWFGGFDGLIRYNSNFEEFGDYSVKTLIRRITVGKDSLFYAGSGSMVYLDSIFPEFKYRLNNIHFEFVAPCYRSGEDVLYKYYLEGFDNHWSEWTNENFRDYTNLSEGVYTFHVRAKNLYEHFCEESKFRFRINPPIYRTWYAYVIYIALIVSFVIMIFRWREYLFAQEKSTLEQTIAEKTEEIVKQKERAEQLVANILPPDTAKELQSKGRATRRKYKMVTVLFSDIQGFTKIAEHMNPERLLDELDKFFFQFDNVVEKMNIEKIKTIGDAYMCAGGIPKKNRTNPIDVVLAGIIMRQYMHRLQGESENEWDIRIGIHTGPVIAGVVGSKKLSYDIWGDTVNIASRMESSGKVGEINISEISYELVHEFFDCEPRGKIPVKYKGDINMYFVKGIKRELSIEGKGAEPNDLFKKKLQFIRFDDLEELIMHRLEKGLPSNLYYHNLKHTIDVVVEVEIIGTGEGVSKEELLLLKTAALFHDAGFLIGYDDHELLGIKIARETLTEFFYTEEQIKIVCDMIYATRPDIEARNQLERIICDADLDYLGRTDYIPVSQNLFRELFERDKVKTMEEWHKMQIKFIKNHSFYTKTAEKMREEIKMKHLEELRQMI